MKYKSQTLSNYMKFHYCHYSLYFKFPLPITDPLGKMSSGFEPEYKKESAFNSNMPNF